MGIYVSSRLVPITICLAIAMHFIWSVSLGLDPGAIRVTAINMIMLLPAANHATAALFFGVVAFLAIVGLILREPVLRVLFILPQQVTLWFSFVGVAHAIWVGHYASGVVRSPIYLLVDQVPVVLITLGHTVALLLIAGASRDRS